MKKTLILPIAALVVVVSIGAVSANMGGMGFGQGGNMKTAIEANDYSSLSETMQSKITQEKFDELVVTHSQREAKHEENKAKMEIVIKNNDFDGFKALVQEQKADKEANRPEGLPEKEKPAQDEAKMEQKLQEKFTKLTEYYAENGSLPERMEGKGGMRGGEQGMRGGEKGMKGGKQGMHRGEKGSMHCDRDEDMDDEERGGKMRNTNEID